MVQFYFSILESSRDVQKMLLYRNSVKLVKVLRYHTNYKNQNKNSTKGYQKNKKNENNKRIKTKKPLVNKTNTASINTFREEGYAVF